MEINNSTELISILSTKKIMIFGAGYVAKRFYGTLKEHGINSNVVSFIASSGSDLAIDGLSIITTDQLKTDDQVVICVAVHESIKDEIISDLVKRKFINYIWIYPFLYELLLGAPICRDEKVSLSNIWNTAREDYGMAIRYLALDNYYGRNTNGFEFYKKYLSLFNSEKTSEKRLTQFVGLIKNWEQSGYDTSKCSSVFENYKIFDGAHRIAIASYFKQEFVMCNIYPMTKNIDEIHNNAAIFNKESVLDAGLDHKFIELLHVTNQRIEEQYI